MFLLGIILGAPSAHALAFGPVNWGAFSTAVIEFAGRRPCAERTGVREVCEG